MFSLPKMAASKFSLSLTLAILSVWAVDAAHHHVAAPSPSPSADCTPLILKMVDCLSFVSSGSEVSKPEGKCCSGLKTVLKADPDCLCVALKSSASFGVSLNITKAETLPAACKVSAPSITNCAIALTPAGSPAGSNEVAPAPAPGISGSPVLCVSIGTLFLGIFIMLVSGYYG